MDLHIRVYTEYVCGYTICDMCDVYLGYTILRKVIGLLLTSNVSHY